jgi:hypothetical protein
MEPTDMRKLVLPLLLCLAALPASALTLDELLQKNLAARGGAEKIAALKSVRFTGTMKFSGWGGQFALNTVVTRSGKFRSESTMQGLTQITAWDGHEGWSVSPFGGRKDPERMSADDAKGLMDDADIDGPLIGWREAGSTLVYQGTEDVDGTEAHKIKVTLANGDVKTVYLDPDYFLEIRITTRQTVRGVEEESETDFGDYAQVEGVWFPMALESGAPGESKGTKVSYDKIVVNGPAEDRLFSFPAASPPPNAPAKPAPVAAGGKS